VTGFGVDDNEQWFFVAKQIGLAQGRHRHEILPPSKISGGHKYWDTLCFGLCQPTNTAFMDKKKTKSY
jgi:hypothetical protein